jgi:hypothetical protein
MRLRLPSRKPNACPGFPGAEIACHLACATALAASLACAQEVSRELPSPDEIRRGIEKSVQVQFQACNEENMEKLLAVVSEEMPSRRRFITEVDSSWSVNDAYTSLERVEILDDSDAPGAQFEYPYATARITQTVLELRVNDERTPVFLRKCRKGDREPAEIAKQLGVLSRAETSSAEVLFKHEDGEWKLVNGLTEGVKAGTGDEAARSSGIGVPCQRRIKVSGSVFN